jgi:acyl-CoA reductase-like NAD-dependent aldehyde dehydrogenase
MRVESRWPQPAAMQGSKTTQRRCRKWFPCMTYQTINPYTNEVVATFPDATLEKVDTAIAAAHSAFLA